MKRPVVIVLGSLLICGLLGCGGAPPPVETADEDDDEPPPTFAIALRLEDGGQDENETPSTIVRLVRISPEGDRDVAELGEEIGACYHQADPGVLIAARCWWAGQGSRYRVRRVGDRVVALRAVEDEDAEPGEFAERGHVEVPANAQLQILTPGAATPTPE